MAYGCQQTLRTAVMGLCLCCAEAQAKNENALLSYSHDSDNPVIEFTRSLVRLNKVAEMCQDVQTADYRTYAALIQQYVKLLYNGELPYWVLTKVKDRLSDQRMCKFLVTDSLVHYQFAYRDFVDVAQPKIMPPVLTEAMSEPGYVVIDQATLGVARPSTH